MNQFVAWMATAKKFLAAITGAAAVAVTAGVLPGSSVRWVDGVLAVVTAFVVYFVPNAPAPGTVTAYDPNESADASVPDPDPVPADPADGPAPGDS